MNRVFNPYLGMFVTIFIDEIFIKSLAFIGHIVSGDGIRVDTQKIEAVHS